MARTRCNLCGGTDFKLFFKTEGEEKGTKFFPSSDVIGNESLVRCKNCNLVFVNPMPDEKKMIAEYSDFKDDRFASQAKGREITFSKNMTEIEKYAKKGRILDIGSANGSFLFVAKNRGWRVEGVELNKYLIKWAKENYNLDLKQGTIFENSFKNNFNVVTLWDVLEHVSDPSATLKRCHELLDKNGVLVVNYPDYKSIISKILAKKWPFYLSVHLYYFDRQTIAKMLEKNGFKIIKIKPHIQYLDLGYILFRAKKYLGSILSIPQMIVSSMGLNDKKIPYWIGQTLVIARKK